MAALGLEEEHELLQELAALQAGKPKGKAKAAAKSEGPVVPKAKGQAKPRAAKSMAQPKATHLILHSPPTVGRSASALSNN